MECAACRSGQHFAHQPDGSCTCIALACKVQTNRLVYLYRREVEA